MRSLGFKHIFTLILLTLVLVVGEIDVVKGQVKNYLEGLKTGNYFGGPPLKLNNGTAFISPPMVPFNSGALSTFRYFRGTTDILNAATTTPTTLRASQDIGVLGVLGAGSDVYIQFRNTNNNTISGGKTTYFKLKEKPALSGLSIPVGALLGIKELQGIKGRGYFGTNDYAGNTENNGNPVGTPENTTTEMLIDKNKDWYAAITPPENYNSVRLEVSIPSDLRVLDAFRTLEVNVYNAFTISGSSCSTSPQFTNSGKITGISILPGAITGSLELGQLIENPERAINDNLDDYSAFSSGVAKIGITNSVSQSFFFDHKSIASDKVRLQLGITNSLVDLDLLALSRIKFKLYNGMETDPVYEKTLEELSQILSLNLLNLVAINGSSHKKLDLTFTPVVEFDKLEIIYEKGLLDVNILGDALRIYDVSMASSLPNITIQPTTINSSNICEGSPAQFSVTADASDGGSISGYQWQQWNGLTWIPAPSGNTNILDINTTTISMNNTLYRVVVSGGSSSCPKKVISNEVLLTVTPTATASDIIAPDHTICLGQSVTLTASSTTITNPIFNWYSDEALTNSINTNLTVSPIIPTSYYVTVKGTGVCENAPTKAKKVTITVTPLPHSPNIVPVPKN